MHLRRANGASPIEEITFEQSFQRFSHYLFRYPAKFHPPVARYLVEQFSHPDQLVGDPFCGSGTLLVEGAIAGRKLVGVDVDPVAVHISRAKTLRLSPRLENCLRELCELNELRSADACDAPSIPNIHHWFEPHVLADMCALFGFIENSRLPSPAFDFALAVFLGRIRSWSNADPVPVSGLEVTAHIKKKRAGGHFPDVLRSFQTALRTALKEQKAYSDALPKRVFVPEAFCADSAEFFKNTRRSFDALITSPPYLSAVDYYRRHTLEMYWLDRSLTPEKRVQLRRKYIGQYSVSQYMTKSLSDVELSSETEQTIDAISDPKRRTAARHYFAGMKRIFEPAVRRLKTGGVIVMVVGDGKVGDVAIETGTLLMKELVPLGLHWQRSIRYPLRNRYMTYTRRNGADIAFETIYVARKE